jgi:hypothetical protein
VSKTTRVLGKDYIYIWIGVDGLRSHSITYHSLRQPVLSSRSQAHFELNLPIRLALYKMDAHHQTESIATVLSEKSFFPDP